MFDSNSAVERIKNHLAYKLGQAMIDFKQNGGGYIALFKKFYKIKKQHKKEQKIYQQTIQVFPQLKYPSLEKCSDYEQALRYKFHLSYMLGEVLIKAYQNWYKGAGFKLKNNIKKANKEFQIFREIFKEFDQINSSILEGLIDNKQLFLKEFPRIKNILKIHQDYKAILDNIFHNFNYFIQNFDLIEEWLLSDDFKERYKKENHPYPSLLNPKKLNDETEDINYNNIPAELAWEMNLPLPDRYKFVLVGESASSHSAIVRFLKFCNVNIIHDHYELTARMYFILNFNLFLSNNKCNILYIENAAFSLRYGSNKHKVMLYNNNEIKNRFLFNLNKNITILYVVRDPISRISSFIKRKLRHKNTNYININSKFKDIFYNNLFYPIDLENEITLIDYINDINNGGMFEMFNTINYSKSNNILYIDHDLLKPNNVCNLMSNLSTILKFDLPSDTSYFKKMIMHKFWSYLPLILKIDVSIIIEITYNKTEYMIDLFSFFNINSFIFNEKIYAYTNNKELNIIKENNNLYKSIFTFLNNFIDNFNYYYNDYLKNIRDEKYILHYFKNNIKDRQILKQILDKELSHIKQHRPDIVASWKYYQEFEQMCKELDDDIQEKDFVN
ncbi:DUF2972 domain-containing protein [Campylobacter jejuni]|nr:DUF2972 domain-containing protein [Campylobacter jejuni]